MKSEEGRAAGETQMPASPAALEFCCPERSVWVGFCTLIVSLKDKPRGRGQTEKERDRCIFHPLVSFPNTHHSWGWTRLKPEAGNCIEVPRREAGTQGLKLPSLPPGVLSSRRLDWQLVPGAADLAWAAVTTGLQCLFIL